MSHHYSGPDFGFPRGDARLDLTDLYAFPKPGEADKSILIMNVHPSEVVDPPGPTTRQPFASTALYEIKIDTNGDAVADIAYRVRFSSSADGSQTATVRRVEGAQAAETGDSGQVVIEAAPVSTGRDALVTEAGGYRFFAGWRSDPFFFDTRGALNDLQFTGDDFFIDKDVCSIVLELPNSALGPKPVGLWARTLDGASGVWVQADRGALPAQAVFLVGSERDGYRLEIVLYTAKAHTTGGRTGTSRSSDGRLEVQLSRPDSPGTGTNPEQLFAAGWSACFESAMEFAARNIKITLPADHAVDAEIDLGPDGGGFSLAARLYVSLPGMERATAQRLVEATHQVCPYSRATHGNIAVETRLV